MTDAEKYTEIIKTQGIKSVTMEKGCDIKYCPNGLPFECFEDTYKYLFIYEW